MLIELRVENLGVIDELTLAFGPGMTALTGETGAGKTLVVGAIDLLVGGRADPALVRDGAEAAIVDGRFELDGEEVVISRVVPRQGRSRSYVDGRPVAVARLEELGARLVDLHGQHDHQSLLRPAVQRGALDRAAGVDLAPLVAARRVVAEIDRALEELGGDDRARARELDLARYQLEEIDRAGVDDPGEEDRLRADEALLANATAHRDVVEAALDAVSGDGGAREGLSRALAALGGHGPFEALAGRLQAITADLDDLGADLRATGERIDVDPARLSQVQERRRVLTELRRKYADTLDGVLAVRDDLRERVMRLERHDEEAAELGRARVEAVAKERREAAVVGRQRRRAAEPLARAVEAHLAELALESARLAVVVGDSDPGDDVTLLLSANPGATPLPLAKVASGGELARTMLALRLVLTDAPPTLLFDEVDAGIGGEAAVAVGRALASLGGRHQVLVVTHLPQVAAAADAQVSVRKTIVDGRTVTTAVCLDREERLEELSRMLAGRPGSSAARRHAAELLAGSRLEA